MIQKWTLKISRSEKCNIKTSISVLAAWSVSVILSTGRRLNDQHKKIKRLKTLKCQRFNGMLEVESVKILFLFLIDHLRLATLSRRILGSVVNHSEAGGGGIPEHFLRVEQKPHQSRKEPRMKKLLFKAFPLWMIFLSWKEFQTF